MADPIQPKSYSEYYGADYRRKYIDKFRLQKDNVINILDEIAAKQAELVEKTPFDSLDDEIVLKVIDTHLKEIYNIIPNNSDITGEYVEETIEPIQEMLEFMDEKINILLPKRKKEHKVLLLRDPVYSELFDLFRGAAGSNSKYKRDLKIAQLKIAYAILFYVSLRVNDMRFFKEKDISDGSKISYTCDFK